MTGAPPEFAGPRRARLVAWLALASLAGCVDGFAPDLGAPLGNKCRNRDGDPDNDVGFAEDVLTSVFRTKGMCLPCHDPKGDRPEGYLDSGLDLTTHGALMAGGANSAHDIVIPGEPCSSRLYLKLGAAPPSGSRMPLQLPALSAEQLNLVHDWIAEGAKDN